MLLNSYHKSNCKKYFSHKKCGMTEYKIHTYTQQTYSPPCSISKLTDVAVSSVLLYFASQ